MTPSSETFFFNDGKRVFTAYVVWWFLGSVATLACLPALGIYWPLALLWPLAVVMQWRWLKGLLALRALQFDGHYCLLSQTQQAPLLCQLTGRWRHLPWLIAIELLDEQRRRVFIPVFAFAMDPESFRRLRIRVNTGQCNGV